MPSRLLVGAPTPQPRHSRKNATTHHAFSHKVESRAQIRTGSSSGGHRQSLVLGLAIGGGACFVILLVFVLLFLHRRLRAHKTSPCDVVPSLKLHKFSYRQLKKATAGFSDARKLGQGGFGSVFKGILKNGQEIAVKRLDTASLQGEREFQNEVSIIGGKINSPHIVGLLGFYADNKRKLLVYEFMENRSLQEALFDENYPVSLDWNKRFKVILDIARALAFLHLKCDPPIIHGDVKPSNVLLDSSFCARIADFGLARLKTESDVKDVRSEEVERESMEREKIRCERVARERERKERRKAEEREKREDANSRLENTRIENTRLERVESEEVIADIKTVISDMKGAIGDAKDISLSSPDQQQHDIGSKSPKSPKFPESLSKGTHKDEDPSNSDRAREDGEGDDWSKVSHSAYDETEGDNWSKVSPSEECRSEMSQDSGKEIYHWGAGRRMVMGKRKKKISNKDWWWKQDNIGDFSLREYIVDWVSCEPRRGKERTAKVSEDQTTVPRRKERTVRSGSLEWWAENDDMINSKIKKMSRRRRRSRSRESSEWWRDDHMSEMSSKSRELSMKSLSRELWRDRDDLSGDLSCKSKELKSGEGRTKEGKREKSLSEESFSFYFSGELNQNDGRIQGRRRVRTRSREWWSGEMLRGRELWSGELPSRKDRSKFPDSWSRDFSGDLSTYGRDGKKRERSRSRSREWWSGDLLSRGTVSSTPSMRGTVCYVAPEYGGGGILSEKSDVYSFGVLMLVIVSGRRPLQVVASPLTEFERANLISWARHAAQGGSMLDLVDASLHGVYSKEQATLCISLALMCLQRLPAVRPSMGEIVKILSGEAELPTLPFEFSPSPSSFKSHRKASIEQISIDVPLLT